MNHRPVNHRVIKPRPTQSQWQILHLVLLIATYSVFLSFTTPSPTILPALHGVFGLAAIASFICSLWLRKQPMLRGRPFTARFLALALFGGVWSGGTVIATRLLSAHIAAQTDVDAVLFYGTSGTQFLNFRDGMICGLFLLPIACLDLLSHWLRQRLD